MQSVHLQIESSIYEEMIRSGVNIQNKFNEFLSQFAFVDDGYPTIGTEEAKRRVAEAVEEYRDGNGVYLSENEYSDRMNLFMEKLELKYGNS